MFNLDYWKSLAACNRCADFREKKRSLIDFIIAWSIHWSRHLNKQYTLSKEQVDRMSATITACTQKYADLLCTFHRTPHSWTQEFADDIMREPTKLFTIRGVLRDKHNEPRNTT